MFATAFVGPPHHQANRVRALAVTTAKRSRLYPELPTVAEPACRASKQRRGTVFSSAGTPPAIVERLIPR